MTKLVKLIGTPYGDDDNYDLPKNAKESQELYILAKKNKISLTYLEALNSYDLLDKFKLREKWEGESKDNEEQKITAVRFSRVLTELNVDYSLFKSLYPFKATPNDVDVLFYGTNESYKEVADNLPKFGYDPIIDVPSPAEIMFHDNRNGPHIDPKEKDVYDVDLYIEAGASYLIYLDKTKLKKYIISRKVLNEEIKMLSPEADLVAMFTHSVIPEFIFTLILYYNALYYMKDMKKNNLNEIWKISKENNVVYPVKLNIMAIANIHNMAHGYIPENLEYLMELFNISENNVKKTNIMAPFHYSYAQIAGVLFEKSFEKKFFKSFLRQLVHVTKNPQYGLWVLKVLRERFSRDTY
jgi:hypothetical protein